MLSSLLFNPKDYKHVKKIGQGQFGKVMLVEKDKKQFAIKILGEERDSDSDSLFTREVVILAFLNHPAILGLRGFFLPTKEDQCFYLLTDYMPNGTLKDATNYEKSGKFSPNFNPTRHTICVIGIAAGMKCVHAKDIVHRDLKPENIFFDENFYPRIADFGLAKFVQKTYTQNLGTPFFMAPELFDDEEEIGKAIDVYAFANVLLSSFEPEFKFKGKSPKTMVELASYVLGGGRFLIPNTVPEPYKEMINECWAQDPKDRPTFEQIYERLVKDETFFLKGAKAEDVRKYIKLMQDFQETKKKEEIVPEEEEDQETTEFNFDM